MENLRRFELRQYFCRRKTQKLNFMHKKGAWQAAHPFIAESLLENKGYDAMIDRFG
jgi:hypothetical protein